MLFAGIMTAGITHAAMSVPSFHAEEIEQEVKYQSLPVAINRPASVRIPIFIYHSVRPDFPKETPTQKAFSITPEFFEEQLIYLKNNGYTPISLDELAREVNTGTTTPIAKPVVLTFDDGWQNEYVYAFPLLQKYGFIATFFIYSNPIGRDPRFMTWEEIRHVHDSGMTIGDHTLSHPYLRHLTPDQLQKEIMGGKKALEEKLGVTIAHFASPFGYTSSELVNLLRTDGFSTARTTYSGTHHAPEDLLRLTGFLVNRRMHDFIWALEFAN